MSLRGESGARDAAIHRVSENAGGLSVRVVRASGSPRAFSPRDDKGGNFTMKVVKSWSSYIVIARRERSEGRGNPSCLGAHMRGCLFIY